MIGAIDVRKKEAAIASLAVALIADIGDRCLELRAARQLFLVGFFQVFAAAPAHVPDTGGDLRGGNPSDLGEKQPGVVRPHSIHGAGEFTLPRFEFPSIETDRPPRLVLYWIHTVEINR